MNFSRKSLVITLFTLVALVGAFSLGRIVAADTNSGPAPGSSDDPLVSRSYVDNRVKVLEARVAELENKLGVSSSDSVAPAPAPSPSPSQSSTVNPAPEQKVYPKSGRNWANVRSEPNTTASVVAQCNAGTAMTLLETQGEWFKVRMADGTVGYVHSSVAEIK